MKRVIAVLYISLICVVSSFLFVGCDANYASFAGTYKLTNATYANGANYVSDGVAIIVGEDILLKPDKTFETKGIIGEYSGNYTVTANSITLFCGSETIVIIKKHNELFVSKNGSTFIYSLAG